MIAELQRRFGVSAAETGSQELHRRAGIGMAVVSGDRTHVVDVLDAAERLVAARPEMELLVGAARIAAQRRRLNLLACVAPASVRQPPEPASAR